MTEINDKKLLALIERIERLTVDKKAVQADIKQVYLEARSGGYDPKVMRVVIKRRATDAEARQEMDALTETYINAIGGE
ncbi:UPF0335 protein [Alphaproteobacteria bacterium]|nr:UPF0335 protein [Alphaproteobacteria bacterium]